MVRNHLTNQNSLTIADLIHSEVSVNGKYVRKYQVEPMLISLQLKMVNPIARRAMKISLKDFQEGIKNPQVFNSLRLCRNQKEH